MICERLNLPAENQRVSNLKIVVTARCPAVRRDSLTAKRLLRFARNDGKEHVFDKPSRNLQGITKLKGRL